MRIISLWSSPVEDTAILFPNIRALALSPALALWLLWKLQRALRTIPHNSSPIYFGHVNPRVKSNVYMHLPQSEGLVQFGVNLPGLQCQSGEISTLNSVLLPRSCTVSWGTCANPNGEILQSLFYSHRRAGRPKNWGSGGMTRSVFFG